MYMEFLQNPYILLSLIIFAVGMLTYPVGFVLSLLKRAFVKASLKGVDEWKASVFMFRESSWSSKLFWGIVLSCFSFWGGIGGSPLYNTPWWTFEGGTICLCLWPLILLSASGLVTYTTVIIKNVAYGKTEVMPNWGDVFRFEGFINLLKETITTIFRVMVKSAWIMAPFLAAAYFNSLQRGSHLGWKDLISIQQGGAFSFAFWSVWFVLLPANLINSTISEGILTGLNPLEDIRFVLQNIIAYVRVLAYIAVYPYISIMPLALILISTENIMFLCGIPLLIPALLFYNLLSIAHICGQLGRLKIQRRVIIEQDSKRKSQSIFSQNRSEI